MILTVKVGLFVLKRVNRAVINAIKWKSLFCLTKWLIKIFSGCDETRDRKHELNYVQGKRLKTYLYTLHFSHFVKFWVFLNPRVLDLLFRPSSVCLSVLSVKWHAGAAGEVTFGWVLLLACVRVGVGVCAIRTLSGRGGQEDQVGWGGVEVHVKCVCHLESPALARNVRGLRARITHWMRPLYF